MKWEHINSDDTFHHLSVKAEWTELQDAYRAFLKEYSKLAVPGFRPGKAPAPLVEKRFQSNIIDDLSKGAAQQFGREAIHESEIKVWGNAEIVEIECAKDQPFRADLRYHPQPKIELPDLHRLPLENNGSAPQDQLSLALLSQIELDVPERLIEEELELDGLEAKPGTEDWTAAEQRLKLVFILKQIAERDGIKIDEVDVQKRIKEKSVEFGISVRQLQAQLENSGGGLQRLKEMLIAESTLDYLIEINKANP
ncbi:MAG: trigger factor [Verrucomicrobiota bacterium]